MIKKGLDVTSRCKKSYNSYNGSYKDIKRPGHPGTLPVDCWWSASTGTYSMQERHLTRSSGREPSLLLGSLHLEVIRVRVSQHFRTEKSRLKFMKNRDRKFWKPCIYKFLYCPITIMLFVRYPLTLWGLGNDSKMFLTIFRPGGIIHPSGQPT